MGKAKEWMAKARDAARADAVELELPSGMKILARRPDPLQFAAWQRLPFSLATAAAGDGASEKAPSIEDAQAMAAAMRDLLVYCCVEPRVSLDPQGDDEIHPREIPQQDWTFILSWAMRVQEARALEGFRGERADAGSRGDGEAIRGAAVEPAGDNRPALGVEF